MPRLKSFCQVQPQRTGRSFAAAGITKRSPKSMQKIAAVFEPAGVPAFFDERHNTAPEPVTEASLDAQTRHAIVSVTQVDLALFRKASGR
jgi:hypothetical protein